MPSTVDICNRGLQKIGAARITSLSQDTKNARACNAAYTMILHAELTDHDWSCAIARASLSADVTAPIFGRTNYFTLPADFLRLLKPDPLENWAELDLQIEGTKIVSDLSAPLEIRYIKKITDPNEMDALLVEAIASRLALELCEELTQSNTKKQILKDDYDAAIKRAKKANAIQRRPQVAPDSKWVTARRT